MLSSVGRAGQLPLHVGVVGFLCQVSVCISEILFAYALLEGWTALRQNCEVYPMFFLFPIHLS